MQNLLDTLWYGNSLWRYLLWPASLIFQGVSRMRRAFLCRFFRYESSLPVIVVGNLSVGGVGKTPLVIALVKALQQQGLRVAVVSRGYGARIKRFPHAVRSDDAASLVGDEPLLIAKRCNCPVVIAPRRRDAVRYLETQQLCDIIISDDGLQHYKLARDMEIVVIDGLRGLGNGLCLPAGPLREPPARLDEVDLLVVNDGDWPGAHRMDLVGDSLRHLASDAVQQASELPSPVAAVAAIGHPQRFFTTLAQLGLRCNPYPFPDHHAFVPADLPCAEAALIMTEKDAVKCQPFAADHWYYLPVEAQLGEPFWQALWSHDCLKGYHKK